MVLTIFNDVNFFFLQSVKLINHLVYLVLVNPHYSPRFKSWAMGVEKTFSMVLTIYDDGDFSCYVLNAHWNCLTRIALKIHHILVGNSSFDGVSFGFLCS
jgi:hypothetical protein